jgi:glycerol-3-phosphate dehydrogenase
MSNTTHQFDAIILGGGIAGLWLLSLLRNQGFEAILLEKESLGSGQTFASQGMIHGGIKYSLAGAMTGASESISDMPARWRSCLAGTDSVNLSGVSILSDAYYMFSDARLSSKLTAFFGSKAIEGRVTSVPATDYPAVFQSPSFGGLLYKLSDLVLDTRSLVTHLHNQLKDYIFEGSVGFKHTNGRVTHLQLDCGLTVSADTYVLAAGKGNGDLIFDLGLEVPMQLRPLHQVVVKGKNLPDLFAHAVTLRSSDKPRITFTTHTNKDTKAWYLGGQLAESGVARNEAEQIEFAKKELAAIMPWMDYSGCEFSTFRIDRAEAGGDTLLRPDTPYVRRHGNVVVCWPTKLTLAPMMGDMFMKLMPGPKAGAAGSLNLPRSSIGSSPWE